MRGGLGLLGLGRARPTRVPKTLRHVLWIGGPPESGKSTIAARLARRHGLRLYSADTRTWMHRDRAVGEGNPAAVRWEAMTVKERWNATPTEIFDMSLHRERGQMIVDDLRQLPTSPLIVAEGSPVSPALVVDRSRAVWLIPTPEFQHERLAERDPPPAPRRLYLLLAEEIEREAREHAVPILTVDVSRGVDDTATNIEHLFADAIAKGPRAETISERRALLREANEAIAEQIRGYHARPWADGDAELVVRTFVCECGETDCEASVETAVGASIEPVLARGHG